MPQQLIDYRKKFGEENEKRVGKWLVSTLIWLPLLIPSLALGLEWLPHSSRALSPETYLWISGGLVGCWLLVGWLGDLNANKAVVVAFVVANYVASGVTDLASVVEERLKTGIPYWLAILAFLLLLVAHLFLIYFFFLGGWKLFV